MKINFKKLLYILFSVATFGVIVIVAFSNNEMADAFKTLFTLKRKWVALAFCGWLAYLGFDALSLHLFLRRQGHPVSAGFSLFVATIGFYYSNIIPSSGGGQPMQVYYLSKRQVPVGVSTSLVSVRLFCMQLMVVLTGFLLWVFNREAMANQLGMVKWLIIIGGCINFAAVPLVLLAAFYRPPVQALTRLAIRLGTRIRIIKDPDLAAQKVNETLDTFHASIQEASQTPGQIPLQMLLLGLSILGLLSVPAALYHAFGLSGTPWYHVLTVSYLLFWSSSYIPLPGAQEGGFLVFFRGIFTGGTNGLALLVYRLLTFYSFLIVGPLLTLIWNFREGRRRK